MVVEQGPDAGEAPPEDLTASRLHRGEPPGIDSQQARFLGVRQHRTIRCYALGDQRGNRHVRGLPGHRASRVIDVDPGETRRRRVTPGDRSDRVAVVVLHDKRIAQRDEGVVGRALPVAEHRHGAMHHRVAAGSVHDHDVHARLGVVGDCYIATVISEDGRRRPRGATGLPRLEPDAPVVGHPPGHRGLAAHDVEPQELGARDDVGTAPVDDGEGILDIHRGRPRTGEERRRRTRRGVQQADGALPPDEPQCSAPVGHDRGDALIRLQRRCDHELVDRIQRATVEASDHSTRKRRHQSLLGIQDRVPASGEVGECIRCQGALRDAALDQRLQGRGSQHIGAHLGGADAHGDDLPQVIPQQRGAVATREERHDLRRLRIG